MPNNISNANSRLVHQVKLKANLVLNLSGPDQYIKYIICLDLNFPQLCNNLLTALVSERVIITECNAMLDYIMFTVVKLIYTMHILTDAVLDIWYWPDSKCIVTDYITKWRAYKHGPTRTTKISVNAAGRKLKPFLEKLQCNLKETERNEMLEKFKDQGFFNVECNKDLKRHFSNIAYIIQLISNY